MQVKELMTRDVEACRAEETLHRAAQIMWDRDCGIVPVVDGERRVVGVLTDRDICMATYTKDARPSAIRVGDVMSRDVQSCGPDDSLADAEAAMKLRHVRRVPVIDGQAKLVGLLSLNDLAREAARAPAKKHAGVAAGDLVETLASVCTPWKELDGGAAFRGREGAGAAAQGKAVLVPRGQR